MGTPAYAVPALSALITAGVAVRVVTQPDRPRGRAHRLQPSVVGAWAGERGLTVDKPERLADFRAVWEAWEPDLLVTAAYGRILPPWLLALPKRGAYNLHASLLPRWRGANPVRWAIWSGDAFSGVTLMRMEPELDAGPIVAQRPVRVEELNAGELEALLAELGATLLTQWLEALLAGTAPLVPQDPAGVTLAPKFAAGMERLDWSGSAEQEARRVRSMAPEPGAYTTWQGKRIKVLEAHPLPAAGLGPGQARLGRDLGRHGREADSWVVGLRDGSLALDLIQPAGRRPMTPGAFCRGQRLTEGVTLA